MGMFDYFIERVLVHEGGYVNDPRDLAGQGNKLIFGTTFGYKIGRASCRERV